MNKKLVGVLVAVALVVAAYFFGPDVLDQVRKQVGDTAPVTSEVAPVAPVESDSGE